MNSIIWGIIGCGDVAEIKSGLAFKNSKIIAVMKRNAEKAKDFSKRHEVPFWFDSADDLLKNQTINTIYIATPPKTHLELVKNVYYFKGLCI